MNQPATNVVNPFGALGPNSQNSALAAADEAKQIAEIQGRMVIAKKFPRDQIRCADRILQACTRKSLAEAALYSYSRGGSDITGPSIRLAETIAQGWENFDFGFREMGRGISGDGVGYSDVEAFAWDMETNTRRSTSFRVRHWRDTKQGGYAIKEERDIYELVANQAQRRVRACILSVIPGDMVEAAQNACEVTLQSHADTSPDAIKKMVDKFAKLGVTKDQIEARIQRRVESIRPAQILDLRKVYNSINDGMSSPADWFGGSGTARRTESEQPLPPMPDEDFAAQLDDLAAVIESGRQDANAVIAMLSTRATLSDEQIAQIRDVEAAAKDANQ